MALPAEAGHENDEAMFAIKREMERTPNLKVTLPNIPEDDILDSLF